MRKIINVFLYTMNTFGCDKYEKKSSVTILFPGKNELLLECINICLRLRPGSVCIFVKTLWADTFEWITFYPCYLTKTCASENHAVGGLWVSQLIVSQLDNVLLLFLPPTYLATFCNVKSKSSLSFIYIQKTIMNIEKPMTFFLIWKKIKNNFYMI